MTFQQLLDGAEILSATGNPEVAGVEYDSRRVKRGDVFVAMRGETSDGNRFIDQAIALGAGAVITDSAKESPRAGVAWAVVPHGRRALARVSANLYKRPAEKIAVTGITGTNGKSTTAFLIDSIFSAAGRKSALLGTIEYRIAGKRLDAPHTTPEALELNRILAEAVGVGVTEAVMEVSSHALAQERVYGVPFDLAVFTNLTRDHLDFHGNMDDYFASKARLFEGLGTEPPRVAVTNADDEYGRVVLETAKKKSAEVWSYGFGKSDFVATNVQIGAQGTRFDLIGPAGELPLFSPLIGKVNVYNVLAAAASAFARGCSFHEIATGVASLNCVPGRFERVPGTQPFTVVVDYAHTDDALRNLTALAREYVKGGQLERITPGEAEDQNPQQPKRLSQREPGQVITLFGCGGDRDRSKRPLMAEMAARGSDFVILTSDNPRSEDPMAIIRDAEAGLRDSGVKYLIEPDRRKAIESAIHSAQPGDMVLIAGKGHEKVQVSRDGVSPFDDVEVAREVLANKGYEAAVSGETR
jgi:UDP-N-acetylmuramoyl-L-alanyl-D-glutamate--2,6-diaminopimelate ligase